MFVIKLVAFADGRPSGHEGHYVKSYTASGYGGRGKLVTTPVLRQARRWDTGVEALEAWRAVSKTHPERLDGQPNRPLTAWTVSVDPVES